MRHRSAPLVALAAAASAVALAAPAHAAGPIASPTGEEVHLHVVDDGSAVYVYAPKAADKKAEAFTVAASIVYQDGSAPATANAVMQTGPNGGMLTVPFSAAYTNKAAVFQIVAQGGGPVLDTFYLTISCPAGATSIKRDCSETARDVTSAY